ncbi:MAG TPA: hypothetical protein VFD22_10760 [Gemmatimonadaceae bacterium]|nr:hypothetical protein [Gemmatimonadaceae bacterium]
MDSTPRFPRDDRRRKERVRTKSWTTFLDYLERSKPLVMVKNG